jgi:hypothetical protein
VRNALDTLSCALVSVAKTDGGGGGGAAVAALFLVYIPFVVFSSTF